MSGYASFQSPNNWQSAAAWREIESAFHQRWRVGGVLTNRPAWASSRDGTTAAGTDIQASAFYYARQTAIGLLLYDCAQASHYFLKSGSSGNPGNTIPALHNTEQTGLPYWSGSNALWQWVTGTGNTRPRRRTSMSGYPSSGWLYGYCQAGDIIGPWLLEDLQKAMRFMRMTVRIVNGTVSHKAPHLYYDSGYGRNVGRRIWGFLDGADPRRWEPGDRIHWGRSHSLSSVPLLGADGRIARAIQEMNVTLQEYGTEFVRWDWYGDIPHNPMTTATDTQRFGIRLRANYWSASVYAGITQQGSVAAVTEWGTATASSIGVESSVTNPLQWRGNMFLVVDMVDQGLQPTVPKGNYYFSRSNVPEWDHSPVGFRAIDFSDITQPGRFANAEAVSSWQSATSHTVNKQWDPKYPTYGTADYNRIPAHVSSLVDDQVPVGNRYIPWYGCQYNKETYWAFDWRWRFD